MDPTAPWSIYLVIDDTNPEVGLWCETCQLPSGIRVPVNIITLDGVTPGIPWSGCVNCDDLEDEDEDGEAGPGHLVRG